MSILLIDKKNFLKELQRKKEKAADFPFFHLLIHSERFQPLGLAQVETRSQGSHSGLACAW